MSRLPKGWVESEIGVVTKPVGGSTPPTHDPANFADSGGIPWLTPADLSGYRGAYIGRGKRNLTPRGLAACSARVLPAGTVLFSSRAPVGYVAIAANDLATNQGFKSFPLPVGFDPRFVYYYLRHIRPIAEARATGTTFKELSGAAAAKLPFLVVPTSEQKRVADKLDALLARVEACRDRLDRVPSILKRFRQAALTSAMSGALTEEWRVSQAIGGDGTKLAELLAAQHVAAGGHKVGNAADPTEGVHDLSATNLPAGWGLTTLRDTVEPERPVTYGILKPGPELPEGIPYIRVADFPNDRLALGGIRRTSPAIDAEFKRSRLRAGDILLSIRGTVGRLIEIPQELEGANITQDTARLSIQSLLSRLFVLWYLRSEHAQSRMRRAVKGVAVRGINIGDVRALQLPVPSRAEQDEIVRRIEALFALADAIEARFNNARAQVDRLTPSLLAKAFRGELVPQDPNDEPASALLARIKSASSEMPRPPARRGRRPSSTRPRQITA